MTTSDPIAAKARTDLRNKNDGSQGMTLSASEIKGGKVTFEITNSSTDMEHEFLVFRTDMTPEQLPMMDDGAIANYRSPSSPLISCF